jgi:hypothetical protein
MSALLSSTLVVVLVLGVVLPPPAGATQPVLRCTGLSDSIREILGVKKR